MPPLSAASLLICSLLALLLHGTAAQHSEYYGDWMDGYPTPEYRAASVVTNLWIAAFAVSSFAVGLLGAIVALQWPNPRILCYKTAYSDMPSSSARSCCSLYSLNLGFCVFWLLVFAIMVIARDVVRIVVCLCFCLVHIAVVVAFRLKFKRFGRPERPHSIAEMVASSTASGGSNVFGGRQAVGIPIYSIPMHTVVIGGPVDATNTGGAAGQSNYYYDAACVPPVQQPGMYDGLPPPPPPAAAAAVPGSVPATAAGVAGPYSLPPGGLAYPPQPQPGSPYGSYATPYATAAPVAGTALGVVAPALPGGSAAAAGMPAAAAPATAGDASSVGATAGAAAAAGAAPPPTQHRQEQ